MTDRKPPQQRPPPLPPFETYRPAEDPETQPPRRPGQRPAAPQPPPGYAQQGAPPEYWPADPQPPRAQRPPPPMRPPGGPPPQRRRPREDDGSGLFKGALIAFAALVLLAGAGAAYVYTVLEPDFVRDQIVQQVKVKTGRDLTVGGTTEFALYPSVGVRMKDVSLSPPPGMSGKPFVTMASLDASLELLPLLRRQVRLERLILEKPAFDLYSDGAGRKSWSFAASETAAPPVQLAQAAGPASDAPGGLAGDAAPPAAAPRIAALDDLALGDVRIVDGTVRYTDAATGTVRNASAINMKVALASINQPLAADGDLVWKGEKIDFNGEMASLRAVLEDRPAKLALTLASAPLAATFNGSLALRDGIDADGAVDAKSPSARRLAKWFGTVLPPSEGFGALEAKGQLRAAGSTIALSNANLALDGATANGQVTIETAGERPLITANLQVSVLDLNKYMRPAGSPPAAAPSPAAATPAGTAPAKPDAATGAQSIEDLLEKDQTAPGPKVKGYTQRAGWSSEPYDFSGLGAADADAKLTVGKLLFQDIKVGQSQLTVALKNRVLKTNFDDIKLYGGHGRGFVTVDASPQRTASIGTNMTIEGLDALPFLKDATGFDKIAGKAKLTLAVAGQGASQLQLVETLNGKADFAFADGAIVGINVPGMVRGIGQGKLTGLGGSPSEKTDFSELAASWTITNGTAQNQDLRLMSPLLRVTGAGSVNLPQRQVDYTMRPRLVANLAGQGGKQDTGGIEVPVRIQGSWDKPQYTPDLSGIVKDPNKAIEAVKEIGKQFKGKDANEILKGLFGGKKDADAQP